MHEAAVDEATVAVTASTRHEMGNTVVEVRSSVALDGADLCSAALRRHAAHVQDVLQLVDIERG